jgi:uncharacterized protein (TIGR03086 family)
VHQVVAWDSSTPVAGWAASDVVDHLVSWLPGLLSSGGVALPAAATSSADPVVSWTRHTDAVQSLLDDPERASATFAHPQVGTMAAGEAVDRLYTADVFMHTWDLGRTGGREVTLEPEFCALLLAGMQEMEEVLRDSGQYGPRVAVPADADVQTQLIGFIGRDPWWEPPTGTS